MGRLGDVAELPARITKSAMDGRCELCAEALDLFVAAYGAEAGNLALRTVATAGVYVGGGIAPKILPALEGGTFLDAFRSEGAAGRFRRDDSGRGDSQPEAGLVGAAVHANAAA